MLEFLRKHQYGLMLVVAILTIIAFVFLYDKNTYGQGGGAAQRGTAFKVYGKGYDASTLQRLDNYFVLARDLGMQDLAFGLAGSRVYENNLPLDFPINLMILRQKGREMGITPSNDEVKEELESLRAFAGDNGKYDPVKFNLISERLGERNFQHSDLMQITRDKITLDRVKGLLAANYSPPSTEIEDAYAQRNQEITAYALKRSLDVFLKEVKVTEEEIKERYEENKETLMSEEKRKIEYVHFKAPEFPKPPRPTPGAGANFNMGGATGGIDPTSLIQPPAPVPAPTPASSEGEEQESPADDAPVEEEESGGGCDGPEDEAVVEDVVEEVVEKVEDAAGEVADEAKSLAEGIVETLKKEEEMTKPAPPAATPAGVTAATPAAAPVVPQISEEEKKEINREFSLAVKESIDAAFNERDDVELLKLAEDYMAKAEGKKFSGEHKTTELFDRDNAPEFLKKAQGSSRARTPVEIVFSVAKGELSQPERLRIDGRENWIVFRVVEVVEPKQLTLEEATERITEELKNEKATEAMEAALTADAKKIEEEMKASKKSFKESADKLGIEYARHYKFVGRPKPAELGTYFGYQDLVASTVAGAFSEPKLAGDKGYLVYVAAKDLPEDETAANKKQTIADQLSDPRFGYGAQIFKSWLEQAYKEAEPERKL